MHQTSWLNKDAADYLHVLINKYGLPSAIDPSKNGTAIWKKNKLMNTCFDRIELKDESIPHAFPSWHRDALYVWINYDVAPSKFLEVTSLSGTLSYDPLKKQLRVRCGSIESCISILALCSQIGEGHISLNFAQRNDLFGS